jgi:hypothetical protein
VTGSLRTYLGTAPGVGKTFAMLAEGRRRAEAGEKVVVGLHAAAVLCLVIAVGSGWYDYRVWTFRTRRIIV